ncbi:MAG: NnrU family protein [Rhodobacteraceae bacterium]|nr:NnrU family protein [Paracoccaceae bacterium]
MSFGILILGVLLWGAAHFFKRLMPAQRAALGDRGKGVIALTLVGSIVLMVLGFRAAPFVEVWSPPSFMVHINNLLVLVAIYMMTPAPKKGVLLNKMRHPMLTGFMLWAIAHLLVNGDVAGIILFGGLLLWVPIQVKMINAAEPDWSPAEPGTIGKDAMFLVASVVILAVIGFIHGWLGPWPFPS